MLINYRPVSPALTATEHGSEESETSNRASTPKTKGGLKSDKSGRKSKSPFPGRKGSTTSHKVTVEKLNVKYVVNCVGAKRPLDDCLLK